jgi:hypothetical protein
MHLTFKELFNSKKFAKFAGICYPNHNKLKNSWKELEEEIIENPNINRKIKQSILNRFKI